MKKKDPTELRRRAEARLEKKRGAAAASQRDPDELRRLVHELEVHQVELEIQNEELVDARGAAEEALALYADLYDQAPAGYLSLGPAGEIRKLNAAAAKILGLDRTQLVGESLLRFAEPSGRADLEGFLRRVFDSAAGMSCELALSGRQVEIAAVASDDRSECRVIATDVTERRRAEAERDAMREGLALSDRLSNLCLVAASVSHEINNPLTYVLSNLETLVQELPAALPATSEHVLNRAELALGGARRILTVSRALSTFSRVESRERKRVELGAAIDAAIGLAHNEIRFRATLIRDYGSVPPVVGTEGKLAQVFLNLLLNAAQAVPGGGPDLHRITVRTWTTGGSDVFASVTDTGGGIPPENLGRIFDAFFTTKGIGASGLGLAVCRNIVGDFGGDISAESQPGAGARFVVRLLAATGAADVAPAPGLSPAASTRGRLLVVDDEAPIRSSLRRMLGKEHDVVEAESGIEARSRIEANPAFDVIVSDLMMPRMSGMELYEWIAANHPELRERVIFITGGAFTPAASEFLDRTGNTVIEKPFDFEMLSRLIGERIAASRRA